METGVGLIQEPVFTKTSTEEAPAGVLIDHSSMEQKEQIDTGPVKVEKSLNSDREETSIKSDEVKVEKDETATNGESVHDVETTKRVLFEPKEKDETEIVKTVVEDAKIINHEETTGNESKSLRENAEPVEAEQITSEVTLDKEKDEDMTRKTQKVQESTPVIDTPTIQESEILKNLETKTDETDTEPSLYLKEDQKPSDPVQESITIIEPPTIQREEMESPELKEEANQSSKDTEEDEHVLERNIVPEAENLETKEDEKPIMDLKEQEETKTVISSDEKEESPEEKDEKNQDNKPETVLESRDKDEEIPSDLVLKVDKEELKDDDAAKVDKVVEEQRGVESNDPEAEQTDGNKTEEIPTLPDVEPVEQMQNPSLESYSQVSEETSKTVDKANEQEKETQEVTNVEGKADEVVREDDTVVGMGRNADMKANEDEEKVDIIQRSLETVETTQPHSSLLSSLEKQEHGTVAEAEKPTGDTEEHEHVLVREIPQDDSLVTEAESVLETLETKEDTEPIMDLKEQEETETHLLDEPCGESDKYQGNEPDTSKTLGEKKPEEATQHQEGEKEGCYGLETKPESSEVGVKSEEEESSLPNKQEKETCFQKEQIEKHEPTNEENTSASPSAVEAEKIVNIKADEEKLKEDDIEESLSSVQESPKVIEREDIESKEHVLVRDIPQSETVETSTEPSLDLKADKEQEETETDVSFDIKDESQGREESVDVKPKEIVQDEKMKKPSYLESPSKETSKTEDEKMEEIPKVEVTLHQESQEEGSKGLETISEQTSTDLEVKALEEEEPNEQEKETKLQKEETEKHEPTNEGQQTLVEEKSDELVQASAEHRTLAKTDGTESTVLVAESEEEKPRQVKDAEERKEVDTIPQEPLSDDVPVQIQREDDAIESHKEEQQTRDIGASLTEKFSTDQTQLEEQVEGETKTKEPEDEYVDSSESFDNEPLIAETKKEDEAFENLEAPTKLEESKEDKSQENSETIKTKEEAKSDQILPVETSQADQTPFAELVSEHDDQTHEEAHKEEAKSDQNLPVEALHEHETPSSESVSGLEDQTSKQVEKIHEEETKSHELQEEKIIPTEIVPRESITEAPASMLASQEDNQVLKPGEIIEEQDENSDDFTFSKETREAEHGDESSSTLPVVGILTQLQTTLENERAINDSASSEEKMITEPKEQVQKTGYVEAESSNNDLHSIKEGPETLEKHHLVTGISEANKLQDDESGEIHEENKQEEHKEEVKVPEEETREIVEQEERSGLQDLNASTAEKISLQEEHPRDFEISKKVGDVSDQVIESELPAESPQTEQKEESHETVKEEDQLVDIKEEKKNEEVQDEKIRDKEDTNALDFVPRDVEKEEAPHSVLENEEEIKEEGTSEKEITEPTSESEKESTEEHVENQAISEGTKSNGDRDFLTEERPKDQREEVSVDKSLTKEAPGTQLQYPNPLLEEKVEETSFEVKKAQEDITKESANDLITDENVQDQPKNFETGQEQKSSDHTYVQEDNGTNVKPEDVHDSVATQKEEICFKEEKREVGYVKTDAIKHEVSVEEKNNAPEETDLEATKEIYQEESKQTDTVTPIKEEQKETTPECLNSVKNNTDDTTEKSKPVIREIENLPSVSNTQDNPKQKDEVPIPKLENVKTTEELQQKDKESENIFSEVKEETVQEPARKSLSSLIEKVEGTNKNEDTTTKPEIKEEAKTEEEDDKTSPDSIVMVEAKDTVSIIKTQHKKSQGILSGVGSKVKHSISKVKKVFTGGNKSSHTTN